jgi:hypothetical protein
MEGGQRDCTLEVDEIVPCDVDAPIGKVFFM